MVLGRPAEVRFRVTLEAEAESELGEIAVMLVLGMSGSMLLWQAAALYKKKMVEVVVMCV